MSATDQIPVTPPFTLSILIGGELQFPWKGWIALILPVMTFYDAFLMIRYDSNILYRNVLICIRYASCKRHPE